MLREWAKTLPSKQELDRLIVQAYVRGSVMLWQEVFKR